MLRLVPLLKGRPGLFLSRPESSSPVFQDLDQPVPRTGGRPQFWREPNAIYTGPYVNPLHRGPDYSVVGGTRTLATNKAEADRLMKQKILAKKIVQLLGEIKTAEQLYEKQRSEQKTLEDETTRWTPTPKGKQEIC